MRSAHAYLQHGRADANAGADDLEYFIACSRGMTVNARIPMAVGNGGSDVLTSTYSKGTCIARL